MTDEQLNAKLDSLASAIAAVEHKTTHAIGALEDKTTHAIAASESRILEHVSRAIVTEIAASEDRVKARIERVETTMLREFHGYARGVSAQLQALSGNDVALQQRLSALEDRMLTLEARIRGEQ